MSARIVLPVIGSLLIAGCKKELEIDYHYIEPLTVVEASLTESGATASLTLTTPMDEPMNTSHLTDAAISLTDLTDGEVTALVPGADGVYVAKLEPATGHCYRLDVERGTQRYVSECVMQPEASIAEASFSWIKMPYDEVAVLSVFINDNPSTLGDAYWVRVFRNGEVYKWVITNDKFAFNGLVEVSMMTARRNPDDPDDEDNIDDGDLLTVSVTAIPEHIYQYLTRLSSNTIAGPTAFSGDFCLGYFLASTPAYTTLTFSR